MQTRQPAERIGIRLGTATRDIEIIENRIEGFATQLLDLREEQ